MEKQDGSMTSWVPKNFGFDTKNDRWAMSYHICYLEIFGVHSSQQIQREVLASFQPFLTIPWLNCGESHWRSGVLINGFALTILVRCVRELRVGFQLVLVPMATPGRGLQIHSNRIHCKPSSYWGAHILGSLHMVEMVIRYFSQEDSFNGWTEAVLNLRQAPDWGRYHACGVTAFPYESKIKIWKI